MTRAGDPERELLDLYARELAYVREQGAEFAAQYPKIAARLGISGQICADPHVERLIEAFAFLNARLSRELEAELPQLTTSLLGVLYPQLACPVPAMAIAAFDIDPRESKLGSGYTIEKHTPLFATSQTGPVCRFRTAYPVTLWPVEIKAASMIPPETLDVPSWVTSGAAAAMRIDIATGGVPLDKLGMKSLRFYISGGGMGAALLYDLVGAHTMKVFLLDEKSGAGEPPGARLRPVGFEADEDVLPYPIHAHRGHRLIQEYFSFPEKFFFFDIEFSRLPASPKTSIIVLFNTKPGAGVAVRQTTLRLGCTPVTNLFSKSAEPIRVDQRRPEYRLIADVRRERTTEIHSIQRVAATAPGEPQQVVHEPFFSFAHRPPGDEPRAFWHARRVPTGRKDLPGTDVWLSFVDLDFNPRRPPSSTVYATVLCTNRDLADEINMDTTLQLERPAPVKRCVCLTKPTPQRPAPLGGQALWRLVSNLSLNHLSISDGRAGVEALREILRGYIFGDAPDADRQIDGIVDVRSRPVTRRLGGEAWRGFCRGTEVTLTINEDQFAGSSPILLASVLSRFFALYAHMNSFTELVLKSSSREKEWTRWPLMAGERALL
jgi:type VI secretion system protein ImpG